MSRAARIPLRMLAHGRAGDKDGVLNLSVIARDEALYPHLRREVTAARIRARFVEAGAARVRVRRYELPRIGALNFIIYGVLGGDINRSQLLDKHGKTLIYLALDMSVPAPARFHPPSSKRRRASTQED